VSTSVLLWVSIVAVALLWFAYTRKGRLALGGGTSASKLGAYGHVATAHESAGELQTLFGEVEEYFDAGASVARGATVVDVGANIGAFAIAAAKRCERDVRVICFEPVPSLFRALEKNLRENEWLASGRHSAFNVALSTPEEDGTPCEFYYFRRFPRDSTMDLARKRVEFEAFFAAQGARAGRAVSWLGPGARLVEHLVAALPKGSVGRWASDRATGLERIQVPRTTLADALRAEDVKGIDLLKVDVEGAEAKVLAGLDDETWSRVRQVIVEADGSEDRTRTLVDLMTSHGLAVVRILEPPSTKGRGLANVMIYAARGA
jgi:FkbM family methyltransferase